MKICRRKLRPGRLSGCRIERPLRVGPGRSASLRPTAAVIDYCPGMRVAKRNAREQKDSPFSLSPRLSPDSRDLRRKAADERQCIAHPAEGWQVTTAVSEESPVAFVYKGQKRLFLPPCTAHSFSARRKRMGVQSRRRWSAIPGTRTGTSPPGSSNFPRRKRRNFLRSDSRR